MREETKRNRKVILAKDGGKSERASSTDEAGEPSQGTPQREGARRVTESLEGKAPEQPAPISVQTKLERVAKRAQERPQEVITNLNPLIDVEWLLEAHRRTRKDGASGVDGVTAKEYGANLQQNLATLLERLKSRTHRAPPVKRVHIPKGDGSKTRPIGIPTFEDKVLQRAVTMIVEAVYEQQFRNCSYGFRPRRSAHQAIDALREGLMQMKGGFVVEVDIQGFFDSLDHAHLRTFLDLRVRDGVIRKVIGSWLKAGVLEDGSFSRPDEGTPQGGVISPLLANIFLHEVLDVWFEDEIKPRLTGKSFLVRYADDFVIVVDNEKDAHRMMTALSNRFGKFGLTLHPEKTRMVRFLRPTHASTGKGRDADDEKPGTFDFLSFTHYWVRSRNGYWVIKQQTAAKRMRRALITMSTWLKAVRHLPIAEQHAKLSSKLLGHDAYFGVIGNSNALVTLRRRCERIWQTWLSRRSQRRSMTWERFAVLLKRYPLPRPRLRRPASP